MKRLIGFILSSVLLSSCNTLPAMADWGVGIHLNDHRDFGHREFDHRDRYEYRDGHYWLGGVIVGALVVGSIIASLPPRHDVVYIGGTQYYYDGVYYYQVTPSGYVVAQPIQAPRVIIPSDYIPVRFRGVQYYVHGNDWYLLDNSSLVRVVNPTE